jgi:N-acetylmuramic acid 6-phosphate (MurNAc-6-P) etherase
VLDPSCPQIAKLGGIEPLVGLLVSGASEKSMDYAAGALASLANKHGENRTSIAKRLVGLLNGKVVERAVRVLSALSKLSADSAANQVAIAKTGGIPPVIVWLASTSEEAQREAAFALLHMAQNNTTTQVLIAKSGGIPPLIQLVSKGDCRGIRTRSPACMPMCD